MRIQLYPNKLDCMHGELHAVLYRNILSTEHQLLELELKTHTFNHSPRGMEILIIKLYLPS